MRLKRGEQTSIPRTYCEVFAGAFQMACLNAWACVLNECAPGWQQEVQRHEQGWPYPGSTVIFVMSWFGKQRYVVHRAVEWKDNVLWSEPVDNWRDLEAPARDAILARFGTLDHIGGMNCPPELEARAIWPGKNETTA